jgi:hypothetical protein
MAKTWRRLSAKTRLRRGNSRDLWCLLAQFSRQIVVQIIGMASPKVCGNLAIRPLVFYVAGNWREIQKLTF